MKKAIVIGATSGIGKEIAQLLTQNHYKVGITGRRTQLLMALQNQNPEQFITRSFDVMEVDSIPDHLTYLVNSLGGLDLLILSSGIGDLNESLDFDLEKRTIDTNVAGFTRVVTWAFNYFREQQHGHLVVLSSVAGLRGGRQAPAYNATKAYQINYLEALRQKANHLKLPIIITDVRPGFVDTDMAKGEGKFWVAPVAKAGQQILTAIKQKKNIAYVTKRWALIALLLKCLPNWLYNRL